MNLELLELPENWPGPTNPEDMSLSLPIFLEGEEVLTLVDVYNRIFGTVRPLVSSRGSCLVHCSLDTRADILLDVSVGEIRRWERSERPDLRSGELKMELW